MTPPAGWRRLLPWVLGWAAAGCAPATSPARPAPTAATTSFQYAYVAPAVGDRFEHTASSRGLGTVTRIQGDNLEGPITAEPIAQSTQLQCTEIILAADAAGPTAIEVTCPRGETRDGDATTSWITVEPVRLTRTADEVLVTPATLSAQLQLKYKRLFGPLLFNPTWAVMLAGGGEFSTDRDTPLSLEGAGLFLGETTMLTMSAATARLVRINGDLVELSFRAQATRPYDGEFSGMLTIARATGWLVASAITAKLRGEDALTGFR